MMDFDIRSLVPRFILNDKDGYAMARALEEGLRAFLRVCRQGVDNWGNVDEMPEWRLDELAWEYNIPYDYHAGIEVKREWIRNAYSLSRLYGTPEGIVQYLSSYFEDAVLQENWEYGGDPYHFRLLLPNSWTPENLQWAATAIKNVKNVRSVLDGYTFEGKWPKTIYAGGALYATESGRYAVSGYMEGNWYTDENGTMLLDENNITLIVED